VNASIAGAVVFTDLVGFTEYNDACGDDAAVEVLDRIRSLADRVVARTDSARVVKELGDGLLVWFPGSCGAAAGMSEFVIAVDELRSTGSFPLAIRVGMHAGEVRLRGDDVVGQTVNIAARIVDIAGPMEVVVSEAFVAGCDDTAAPTFEAIGPTTVKGVGDALWLYRMVVPATNFEGLRTRR
jgi:class 3 adenylate cyclase